MARKVGTSPFAATWIQFRAPDALPGTWFSSIRFLISPPTRVIAEDKKKKAPSTTPNLTPA